MNKATLLIALRGGYAQKAKELIGPSATGTLQERSSQLGLTTDQVVALDNNLIEVPYSETSATKVRKMLKQYKLNEKLPSLVYETMPKQVIHYILNNENFYQ